MNNIRIIFFDIDGTLLPFGEKDMRDCVREALLELQRKGIKLFIATGRAPYFLPSFRNITFDGAFCFNGGYCYTGDKVIYRHPIQKPDISRVIHNAGKLGLSVVLAAAKRFGSNFFEQNLEDYMAISKETCNVVDDFETLAREDIYQMMVGTLPAQDELLIAGTESVKIARWWDRAADVIPKDSGKAVAIDVILKYYGYSIEECMAFGDGGNDLDMISHAGIGVAMGNADEIVKKAADYVTDTCDNNGVLLALQNMNLI